MIIRLLILEQIHPRTRQTYHPALILVDVKREGVARGADAVAGVVDAFKGAGLGAGFDVWAEFAVEAGGDAVCVAVYVVEPAVVGVEDYGCVDGFAAPGCCALIGCEGGMDFGG